ncbi:MAG TPA: Gfo/Idh/MocA family oxidoreductase [Steroidobacteraceae bacterium]
MTTQSADRRKILQTLGATSALSMLAAGAAFGAPQTEAPTTQEVLQPGPEAKPKHSIRFGVCGMSHDHIHGMIKAIERGGGELVAAWGTEPDKLATFTKRYPNAKMVKDQDAILDDPSLELVLSSHIANERARIGVRAMKRGKDFLSDKPGITTMEDLALVRRTIAETGRIYGIMYSERLEVPAAVHAGELIKRGVIGKVIQTINIAPHQIQQGIAGGDAGGASTRPDWFWNDKQFGGILCDIGSHQVDQFLYYTGSTSAEVVASQVANVHHPNRPRFQDFGDMLLRGNEGFGYVRLDWFTPDGLGTWGDGRLFILGTEGYMEARKYTNVAVSKQGNNLFVVDSKRARYIDCSHGPLPFGPRFVTDIVERTHTAQDQEQCLLAAELSIRAQQSATRVPLKL